MTVPVADTKHRSAAEDYERIQAEAIALAERALAELRKPAPVGLHWGHVGDMAHYRTELRQINDALFGEGEYA